MCHFITQYGGSGGEVSATLRTLFLHISCAVSAVFAVFYAVNNRNYRTYLALFPLSGDSSGAILGVRSVALLHLINSIFGELCKYLFVYVRKKVYFCTKISALRQYDRTRGTEDIFWL